MALEQARVEQLPAVVVLIQKIWRGYAVRNKFWENQMAIRIQKFFKFFRAKLYINQVRERKKGVDVVYGLCLGCVWVVSGLFMGCVWVVSGLCLGCVWVVFGLCLGCVWVVSGLSGGPLSVSHSLGVGWFLLNHP